MWAMTSTGGYRILPDGASHYVVARVAVFDERPIIQRMLNRCTNTHSTVKSSDDKFVSPTSGNGKYTLNVIFFCADGWPCFPHTMDHVGDKFVHVHIDGFWNLWINIFSCGKKLG